MKRNSKEKFLMLYIFQIFIFLQTASTYAQTVDELGSTVAFLSKKVSMDTIMYGTGFFIATDKTPFLITAEHISKFLTPSSNITIRDKGDKPITFKFSEIIKSSDSKIQWKVHREADIAVLRLYPNNELLEALKNHFLPVSYLYSKKESISRDITITILGFPLALGISGLFSPISRETKPASGFLVFNRFDTNTLATFFVTQDPSVGGFSGAPVFDMMLPLQTQSKLSFRGGKPKIIGIVHGTLKDKTGGKFGAIVPSYQIIELLSEYEQ